MSVDHLAEARRLAERAVQLGECGHLALAILQLAAAIAALQPVEDA